MPNMMRSIPTVLTDEDVSMVGASRPSMGARVPRVSGGWVVAATAGRVVVTATKVGAGRSVGSMLGLVVVDGAGRSVGSVWGPSPSP